MAVAAFVKKVQVSSDGSTYYDVPATDASLSVGGTVLDDTTVGQTAPAYRSKVYGLKDWSIDMTLVYDTSDQGFVKIRDAFLNSTTLYVKYLVDGTSGFSANSAVVETFNLSGGVDDLETVSATLQGDGTLTPV